MNSSTPRARSDWQSAAHHLLLQRSAMGSAISSAHNLVELFEQ